MTLSWTEALVERAGHVPGARATRELVAELRDVVRRFRFGCGGAGSGRRGPDRVAMRLLAAGALAVAAVACWPERAAADDATLRYVSEEGDDRGDCTLPVRPCRSVRYALSVAGKSDQVRVASGAYELSDLDEVVYVTHGSVEVKGGYDRFDHFLNQAPARNLTTLIGVPLALADRLRARGFDVIVDRKGLDAVQREALGAMSTSASDIACADGRSGAYECDAVDLLSHVALGDMAAAAPLAADVWGFVDLNTGREYALVGLANGLSVFDVTDPRDPLDVGHVSGATSIWRDAKVLQRFDHAASRWRSYAYVSGENNGQLAVLELSGLPNRIRLAEQRWEAGVHNVHVSNVEPATGVALDDAGAPPLLYISGGRDNGGGFLAYDLRDPVRPSEIARSAGGYSHDAASMVVTDARASACSAGGPCSVLIDFNEDTVDLWDLSVRAQPRLLASRGYPAFGYVHSGWPTEDGRHLFVHDEKDELHGIVSRTTLRVFSLASLTEPILAGTWAGSTGAIDHNGYVRGNRYYMSTYTDGLTVLDITDPTEPVQVGHFDTYPPNDHANVAGAWGVYPFLPSGNLLISDIAGGLYVLGDRTRTSAHGRLGFTTAAFGGEEGNAVSVAVRRSDGMAGAVSVDYAVILASAEATDVAGSSGTLEWPAGEGGDRTISVSLTDDDVAEDVEFVLVRLVSPRGGAVLGESSIAKVFVSDADAVTTVGFAQSTVAVEESTGFAVATVRRMGSATGAVSVRYAVHAGTATADADYLVPEGSQLTWADGDATPRTIVIPIVDDDVAEGPERFELRLSGSSGAEVVVATLVVTVNDNTVGIELSDRALAVEEGQKSSYTLHLSARPKGTVEVTARWSGDSPMSVAQGMSDALSATTCKRVQSNQTVVCRFSSADWDIPRMIELAPGTDDEHDDHTGRLLHTLKGTVGGKAVALRVTVADGSNGRRVGGLEVAAGVESLTLSWREATDVHGYRVQWKSGDQAYNETDRAAVVDGGSTTSYTIADLVAGKSYAVRVSATSADAEAGPPSVERRGTPHSAAPEKVSDLTVAAAVRALAASWTAVADADGYKVQWKSGSQEYNETDRQRTLAASLTSYRIEHLPPGRSYTVRVRATRALAIEDGTPSDERHGTPLARRPAFAVSAEPAAIEEGGASTITVSITNGVRFAADQRIPLTVSGADAGDYTLLPLAPTLAAGTGEARATLTAVDDEEQEVAATVTVTASHDGVLVGSAVVTVAESDMKPILVSLNLWGIDIAFAPATTFYGTAVDNDVQSTSVRATARDSDATVVVSPADVDSDAPGHQVDLAVGLNDIVVTVTAADGRSLVYRVAVTRAPPPPVATLTAVTGAVAEGAGAAFTVMLDRAADAALTVEVSVTQDGEVLANGPAGSVSIASGETRATLEVATDDDSVVEADGSVTATLTAGAGYTVGEPSAATVTVSDDDAAVFAVAAAPDLIEEGGTATVTVSITNGTAYAEERTVSLSVTGLDADEYRLEPATAVLAAGTTSVTAAFAALEDDAGETPETARIAATVDGAEVGAAELTVEDAGPGPRIAGVPQVGGVLEAVPDDPVADPATAWQWLRDGTSIIGATAREHVPVAADAATALSVRVRARGRERTSAATMPVWPAPSNPPLAADEEELLGTTLTLGSRTFGVGVAGFSRLPGREFGSVEDAAFAAGDRELTLFMMNKWGNLGLATTPALPDADGLTAYWDGYPIRPLEAREVDDRPVWIGRTPQPPEEFERYVTGASDGVRVAVSLRRPLPAATLSALSGTVPEGSAAMFEVALDRAAWSALTVSLTVTQDGAVLAEAAPVSVAFAVGESRATVTLETVDDAVIEGDGAVAATLVAGDGYVLGEETSATVTVEDDDGAVFAVSAAAGELDEGGATTLTVAIANGKTFAADQSIELSVSGSASASDYRLAPATLALAAGGTSASATLTAVRDVAAEPAETVTATATHDGSAVGSATVTIRANGAVVSTATVSAVSGTVTEGAPLTFEVALDTAALQPLRVAATVSETRAVLSGAVPAAVEFAVGERTRALVLATSDDAVVETDSTVTVALGPGDGYLLGSEASSSATVADNDAAIFEVSASPDEIDEGGSATLTVSIAKGVTFAADQSIALSVSGSASSADYVLAPETPTLAAGAGSVTATLTAVDDVDEEPVETATVTATHGGLEVGSATVAIRASDIPSDDAGLASLVLSDVDIGPFSPEATDYAAAVPSGLSSTTVTATANDAGAAVEIADAVGSTLGETRTVRLEEGDNAITVTVAAEDGATTRAYRVAVARAYAAAWGERLPERDIELGAGAGPTGLWSDGETLWVVRDWRSGAVRAYDLDDGSLLAERGFEVAGGSGFPSGLWSDGSTLWVSDFHGGVTAHRLSDGARLAAEDLDGGILAAAGNSGPSGLWSDGSTLWVADDRAWKAFAYRLSDKSRLASKEVGFRGDGDRVSPWGLWSDGETLLVSDPRRGMLHGYRLSDGARQAQRAVDLSTVGMSMPMGLWSDGRVLWVAGERETTVRAYAVPGLRRAAAGTFPVRVSSRAPRVPGGARGGRSVGIPDAALRARIAAALGKPADAALGERELAALTALDARAAGVADLTGLQYAVHLAALDLGDNALVDLRALADLPALTVLNLDRTGADLWPLTRMTALRRLSLRGNGLGDVRALRSLTALRVLDIGANRVADLAPLGGLSALEALRADGNAVRDASALRAMGLRILDLDGDAAAGRSP